MAEGTGGEGRVGGAGRLAGRVALVTGASRGVGLGIAEELGRAGATVYVTGRSRAGQGGTDGLPGTVDAAAERVTEVGGRGIAVPCDHADDDAVEALAGRIGEGFGRLDVLVNNVWGGYEEYDGSLFEMEPWEQPLWRWDKMWRTGVRAHYTTTRAVLPLILEGRDPLIVNVSAGDRSRFLGDVQYDVAKAADDRLAFALARKLGARGVTALAIHPGFTRTERVVAAAPEEYLDEVGAHSARFVGRAVVALATDPAVDERTGGAFRVGTLGRQYGFTDVDGSRPEPFELPDGYGSAPPEPV